jgi:sugar lactone lactonase YvrE
MKGKTIAVLVALSLSGAALADDSVPQASFSTLITTPEVIEGLTSDAAGNLYAPARAATGNCPVYRVNLDNPVRTIVGNIPSGPNQCSPSGLAFGPDGMLYVTQTDRIFRFTPDAANPPLATLFATGVSGTNGLAFDWNGNLWTGDGTTGQGRVWRISPDGVATEVFRIPPMANEVNLNAAGVGGVGRDVRSLPPGAITVTPTTRNAQNTAGSQPLVANGLQFFKGDLVIADTARGALWKVGVNKDSTPNIHTGCDVTFTANTLCMDHVAVQHPLLEGADGFVFDQQGDMWVDANERNAVLFVDKKGAVTEVFRNPINPATRLRNEGPLETPTSPVLVGNRFCTANSDGNRRDNSPSSAGEIAPNTAAQGKIACMNEPVKVPGLALPVTQH